MQDYSQVKTQSVKLFCHIIKPTSGEQYSTGNLTKFNFGQGMPKSFRYLGIMPAALPATVPSASHE